MATLSEVTQKYSYLDLVQANEALDLVDESEYLNQRAEDTRRKARGG